VTTPTGQPHPMVVQTWELRAREKDEEETGHELVKRGRRGHVKRERDGGLESQRPRGGRRAKLVTSQRKTTSRFAKREEKIGN